MAELLTAASGLAGIGICLYDTRHFLGHARQEGEGWGLNRHTNPLCRYVLGLPGGRAACIASDVEEAVALAGAHGAPYFHTCHAGLTELVIPLYHHGEHLATLFCGQCRVRGDIATVGIRQRVRRYGADGTTVDALIRGLPVVARARLLAIGALLGDALHHVIAVTRRAALDAYFRDAARADDHVVRAVRYIEGAYRQPISAREVAAHVCVHPAYLTRLFTARFGAGITDHIVRVRLEHAQTLLRETAIPIHDIAALTGFPDANYFSRRFKAHLGCTPSAYRCRAGAG
ncbi:MAG TPA: PocR ligand-binding domain-containing protein [Armatimonadota bacterium]|nr:PocR ligand-binding domain-containing protein [Armatimonadota bacterium]